MNASAQRAYTWLRIVNTLSIFLEQNGLSSFYHHFGYRTPLVDLVTTFPNGMEMQDYLHPSESPNLWISELELVCTLLHSGASQQRAN